MAQITLDMAGYVSNPRCTRHEAGRRLTLTCRHTWRRWAEPPARAHRRHKGSIRRGSASSLDPNRASAQQEGSRREAEGGSHEAHERDAPAGTSSSAAHGLSLKEFTAAELLAYLGGLWEQQPSRSKIVAAACAAFMFSNLDKVILSIAIIPMALELGWSPSVSGLVQSSFFWGYILVQLPGGYAVARLGGRRMLPAAVALWSLATAALPFATVAIPTLCLSRSMVGLGEGLAPASTTDVIARSVPDSERSGAVARSFSGLHLGSIIALLAGPAIIEMLGWRSSFYIFGVAGLAWCVWWEQLLGSTYDTGLAEAEKVAIEPTVDTVGVAGADQAEEEEQLPWRAFLREPAVQGLMYVHFCNNWFHYTMLAWLPTFYIRTLDLDLLAASQLSLLPPLVAFLGSNFAGPMADRLINEGTEVVVVRKSMQGVAFVVPSILLAAAATYGDAPAARIACITLALGFNSFSLAGLYSNHADLSPKHCSVLLGITNSAGAVPGIIGVTFTGFALERTNDWNLALFAPCIFFFLTGFAVYMATGSSDKKAFDQDHPFEFERFLPAGLGRSSGEQQLPHNGGGE